MLSDKTVIKTKVGTFTLHSREKLSRVIDGYTNSRGEILAGLGEEALTTNADLVIALYDKQAGYITGKEGAKVLLGSFFDFKKKQPRENPEISYVFRINGKRVEMKEGSEKPLEVQATELAKKVAEKHSEELADKRRGRPRKGTTLEDNGNIE